MLLLPVASQKASRLVERKSRFKSEHAGHPNPIWTIAGNYPEDEELLYNPAHALVKDGTKDYFAKVVEGVTVAVGPLWLAAPRTPLDKAARKNITRRSVHCASTKILSSSNP